MPSSLYPTLLRKLPAALSYKLWKRYGRERQGQNFWYTTPIYGQSFTYGGVIGFSSDALFAKLNIFEEEAFGLVRYGLQTLWKDLHVIRVMDIGANNGQWMLKLNALDTRFSLTCFEPFPQLCSFLEALKQHNQLAKVEIYQLAVDERSAEQIIHYEPGATDTASMDPQFIESSNKRQFKTRTISVDDFCERSGLTPNLIKIDVELFEREVLAGAADVLARCRPIVIFESLHTSDPLMLAKHADIRMQMSGLDYELFRVSNQPSLHLTPGLNTDPSYCFNNFVAIPQSDICLFASLVGTD